MLREFSDRDCIIKHNNNHSEHSNCLGRMSSISAALLLSRWKFHMREIQSRGVFHSI